MKYLFRFCLLIGTTLVFNTTFSQSIQQNEVSARVKGILSGKVTDGMTGEPLAGASVYVHEVRTGSVTNSEGLYYISNLPLGKLLVEVSHAGFGTYSEIIEIDGNNRKDFVLQPEVVENQGVTVTGVSGATQIRKAPIPVTVIRKENLMREASVNMIDALSKVPGVSQISTGPAISKPSIRGLGYNRVVVVNDGVRQEGQQWGDEHGVEVDEYAVTKAEVLKGPASLMYGSDALAGVVNFISVVPQPQGMVRGNILANYQSNNRLRGFHADLGGNHQGFIWGVNGTYKAAADYRNKYDGYVLNSKFKERDFSAHAGFNKSWGFAHVLVSSFDQTPGLVEGERDASGNFLKLVDNGGVEEEVAATEDDFKSTEALIPYQRIRHFKITSDNSFNIGSNRLLVTLGHQRNRREEFGDVLNPSERELFFDLRTITYNLQFRFGGKSWKPTIGIQGMNQENTNRGAEQLIPDYRLFDIGGFVFARRDFNKLSFSGGVRVDSRSIDSKEMKDGSDVRFGAFTKSFFNASASAGISYEASSKVTLKFNIARGFRAPGIPELSSNGAHEGSNRYEYGSLNLRSEKSLQLDGGIEFNNEHVSLAANLFYNSIRDFIYYSKLSSVLGGDSIIIDGSDQLFAFQFRQGNARLYGLELNVDIHPHPLDWLHFENRFSYVRGKLANEEDGSDNLPFIPAPRLLNELRGDFFRKGKWIRNAYARVELDNMFSQSNPFTGYNTETATPGYSLLNIGAGADFVNKGKLMFSIFLSANNITDVAYQNHLNRLKYTAENPVTGRMGVFNMGRNFSIKLNIPLSFATERPHP